MANQEEETSKTFTSFLMDSHKSLFSIAFPQLNNFKQFMLSYEKKEKEKDKEIEEIRDDVKRVKNSGGGGGSGAFNSAVIDVIDEGFDELHKDLQLQNIVLTSILESHNQTNKLMEKFIFNGGGGGGGNSPGGRNSPGGGGIFSKIEDVATDVILLKYAKDLFGGIKGKIGGLFDVAADLGLGGLATAGIAGGVIGGGGAYLAANNREKLLEEQRAKDYGLSVEEYKRREPALIKNSGLTPEQFKENHAKEDALAPVISNLSTQIDSLKSTIIDLDKKGYNSDRFKQQLKDAEAKKKELEDEKNAISNKIGSNLPDISKFAPVPDNVGNIPNRTITQTAIPASIEPIITQPQISPASSDNQQQVDALESKMAGAPTFRGQQTPNYTGGGSGSGGNDYKSGDYGITPRTADEVFGDASKLPAGMRNNNPGNIKWDGTPWEGNLGPSKNLDEGKPQVTFDSPEMGMRAMALNLINYQKKDGVKNIAEMMAKYSPSNIPKAIENITRDTGYGAYETLDFSDPVVLKKLMRAGITQEQGAAGKKYTDEMISKGIDIAEGRIPRGRINSSESSSATYSSNQELKSPEEALDHIKSMRNKGLITDEECVTLAMASVGIRKGSGQIGSNVHQWRFKPNENAFDKELPIGTPVSTHLNRDGSQSSLYAGGGSGTRGAGLDHAGIIAGYRYNSATKQKEMGIVEQFDNIQRKLGVKERINWLPAQGFGEHGARNYSAILGPDGEPINPGENPLYHQQHPAMFDPKYSEELNANMKKRQNQTYQPLISDGKNAGISDTYHAPEYFPDYADPSIAAQQSSAAYISKMAIDKEAKSSVQASSAQHIKNTFMENKNHDKHHDDKHHDKKDAGQVAPPDHRIVKLFGGKGTDTGYGGL
jgi:hypothetical protein